MKCNCDCHKGPVRPKKRGDLIPSVSDYAHWNEDAYIMWYQENRYDMENWDEPIEYDDDEPTRYYDEPDECVEFDTKEEAYKYFDEVSPKANSVSIRHPRYENAKWEVEVYY